MDTLETSLPEVPEDVLAASFGELEGSLLVLVLTELGSSHVVTPRNASLSVSV